MAPDADRSTVMAAWMDKRRAAVSMTAMMGSDEVEAVCARLDEAFRTLTHPLRGKRYQRYHRFSRRAEAQQDEQPAPQQELPAELPSILAVSTPTGERPATEPSDARSGWVQRHLAAVCGSAELSSASVAAVHAETTLAHLGDERAETSQARFASWLPAAGRLGARREGSRRH